MRWSIGILLTALLAGCAGAPAPAAPSGREAMDRALEFPDNRFLTAEGTGETASQAEDRALAELARLFEARVESESTDLMRSSVESRDGRDMERFVQDVRDQVRVTTDFAFEGVRTGTAWQDRDGLYHALAALHRKNAEAAWSAELARKDGEISAELAAAESGTDLTRYMALRRARRAWVGRAAYALRLRVIGAAVPAAPGDPGRVRAEMTRLRAGLALAIDVRGDEAELLESLLAEALSSAGLRLADGGGRPGGLLSARLRVRRLDLDNPGWIFVRAEADVRLADAVSDETLSTFSRHARAGKLSFDEASAAAVRKLADGIAGALGDLFE